MWYNCCGIRTSSVNEDTLPQQTQDSSPPQVQQNPPPLQLERFQDSPRIPDGRQSFDRDGNNGTLEPPRRSYLGGLFIQKQMIDWRRGPVIGEGGFSRVYQLWRCHCKHHV
eukprot:TRINITY_DN10349_c0_g1_i4.p2 TRINITY_DN10349_c0_g1~~TRINITY_DN10349_c0_g1_i4.p2  ORF type:complete len:111 (-),score=7.36 TRINITY_DN10349_c0_g1_i4:67-399(-)